MAPRQANRTPPGGYLPGAPPAPRRQRSATVQALSPPINTRLVETRLSVAPEVELAVRIFEPDARSEPGPAGAPMLVVHGLASNARMWDGVATRLAEMGHPVAALDLRGHGRSDKPERGYDWETLTEDLLAVCGALGWSQDTKLPVVAGQSWGGNLVLELAARHPEAMRSAVVVDGGTIELSTRFADWPTAEVALAPPVIAGMTARAFEAMMRTRHEDWPESGIAGAMANVEILPDGTIQPWLSRRHHMVILRLLFEHHPPQRYPEISVPVLVIPADDAASAGGDPRWMAAKREEVRRAGEGLKVSLTRWIPGDHDLHAQHPDQVAALLHAAADPAFFHLERQI